MSKIGFWTWLGRKISNGFKNFIMVGGWVLFPMLIHDYIIYALHLEEAWFFTSLLWLIPMGLTAVYDWYKEFGE